MFMVGTSTARERERGSKKAIFIHWSWTVIVSPVEAREDGVCFFFFFVGQSKGGAFFFFNFCQKRKGG